MVAYINLACYYVFGLPLGCILGYVADLGVEVITISVCGILTIGKPYTLSTSIYFISCIHAILMSSYQVLMHNMLESLKGIWSGMICGTALQTLLLCIILYRTNWSKEVNST